MKEVRWCWCNENCIYFKTDSFFGAICDHPDGPLSYIIRDGPCQIGSLENKIEQSSKTTDDSVKEFVDELFKVAYPEFPPYIPPLYTQQPFICPICKGNGLVPNGFYLQITGSTYATSSCSPEKCRTCGGTGIVWG